MTTKTAIKQMTVETPDGGYRSVPVIRDESVEWVKADTLRVKGEDRLIRLTSEVWSGGPLYGGEDAVLVERVELREGKWTARYSVGRWHG